MPLRFESHQKVATTIAHLAIALKAAQEALGGERQNHLGESRVDHAEIAEALQDIVEGARLVLREAHELLQEYPSPSLAHTVPPKCPHCVQ